MHGYQLNEVIEQRLPQFAGLKPSTAYSALDRLARQGMVTTTMERVGKRPERKVYALTAVGRRRFLELLRENLRSAELPAYSGQIGLLFARALPPHEFTELLTLRRAAAAARIPGLARLADGHPPGSPGYLVADHALAHARTEVDWIDRALATLTSAG
jgi:DNA-binding PadR family transcriptional regulator